MGGPHFVGKGRDYVQQLDPDTQDNRDRFLTLLHSHDLIVQNTRFQKQPKQLHTFRPNIDTHDYETIDYILTPKRWQNTVMDAEVKRHHAPDSDHYPLQAKIRIKLRKPRPKNETTRPKFTDPRKEPHNALYNKQLTDYFMAPDTEDITWPDLRDRLLEAANTHYPPKTQQPRKDYITAATWKLIQQRQHLTTHTPHETEQIQDLRKQIRK